MTRDDFCINTQSIRFVAFNKRTIYSCYDDLTGILVYVICGDKSKFHNLYHQTLNENVFITGTKVMLNYSEWTNRCSNITAIYKHVIKTPKSQLLGLQEKYPEYFI